MPLFFLSPHTPAPLCPLTKTTDWRKLHWLFYCMNDGSRTHQYTLTLMEVLLLEDVNGIGKKNDLLVVGDGFALNCLLPTRKALVATPTVRKRYADQIRKRAEEKESDRSRQVQAASALAGKSLQLARKASKTGKLYAAISEEQIREAFKVQHDLDIASDAVVIEQPIKAVGKFTIQVQVGNAQQTVPMEVTAEK